MYLSLSDFDHLRDDPNVRFREETVGSKEVVIISYMLSSDELWNKPLGIECRGITFDKATGQLLSLPFEKFFNVNEKAHTQEHIIRPYKVQVAMDKRDGSMITGIVVDDKVHLKTKKTFTSDVAIAAYKALTPGIEAFIKSMAEIHFCPIFEFTDPDCKIVLDYGNEPKLVMLAMRDMVDGSYVDYNDVVQIAKAWSIPLVGSEIGAWTLREYLERACTEEGIEGWVLYTDHGRFKIKTQWYCDRHHLIDIRERDIAELVLDEKLDDLIPSLLAGAADMDAIYNIENRVAGGLSDLMETISILGVQAGGVPEGKERAEWVEKNCGRLAKFVFRSARGSMIPDEAYKDFYRANFLKDFSLRSIGNPNFRSEEE